MRNLAVFLITVGLLGCSQYKYPRNEKRALKQLKKSTAKIKQITHVYPGLIDTVFKTKIDTFILKSHEVDTLLKLRFDTVTIDSLIEKIIKYRSDPIIITKYRNEILNNCVTDTVFTYEDSIAFVKVALVGGKLQVTSKLKERKLVVKRNLNQINIKNGFIQDCKWLFIILLIVLILVTIYRK